MFWLNTRYIYSLKHDERRISPGKPQKKPGPLGPPSHPADMNLGIMNDGSIADVYREHPVSRFWNLTGNQYTGLTIVPQYTMYCNFMQFHKYIVYKLPAQILE